MASEEAPRPVPPSPPQAVLTPGMEYTKVPFWVVLAGVGAGAIWALAGVLVGWRIARRR